MPVPGSQVVGFRPLLGHEARSLRRESERALADDKWTPTARVIFTVAASMGLWLAIALTIRVLV